METMKLSERLDRIRSDQSAGAPRWRESFASFYEGVSLLAGTKYPAWLKERLEQYYTVPVDAYFVQVLDHANDMAGWEIIYGNNNDNDGNCGCELMFQMLIEPFYLINEADKEESKP